MCGIFYSNNFDSNKIDSIHDITLRGPEGFTYFQQGKDFFAHALLNTVGPSTAQPLSTELGTLLYNGSTYNHYDTEHENDTVWINNNLTEHLDNTVELIKALRGEYALCYVTNTHVVFATDQWFTRNLWYYYSSANNTVAVCSHPDILKKIYGAAWPCEENTIYILDKQSFNLSTVTTTVWDFSQHIANLDRVFDQFEQSVQLRHKEDAITLISSGLDSGAIGCCLERNGIDFHSIADVSEEYNEIVQARIARHGTIVNTESFISKADLDHLFKINQHPNLSPKNTNNAKYNTFCKKADDLNCKIFICGEGADELYADYGHNGSKTRTRSKFGGIWHENLQLLWPWHNSYSSLYALNSRLDLIMGFNAKEVRLPFQDQCLFQAWLNTSVNLKNAGYKHWIVEYLRQTDYPYHLQKIGMGGAKFY